MANSAQSPESGRGLRKVATSAMFWSYARSATSSLVSIPATIILARLLSPADFGIAAAASFFTRLATRLSTGGLAAALIRLKTISPEHASTVFVFNLTVGSLMYLGLVGVSAFVGRLLNTAEVAHLLPLVGLNFLVSAVFTVPRTLLRRNFQYREISMAETADQVVTAVLGCIFAYCGFGFWSLALGDLSGGIANGLLTAQAAKWRPSLVFRRQILKELLSFGLGSYASKLLQHAALNVDNLIIGRALGMTALGYYDKGFTVASRLLRLLSTAAPEVSFRMFSMFQDDRERLRRVYQKVTLSTSLVGYPLFAGLAVVAPELFDVVFGPPWRPSVVPFQILCVSSMLRWRSQFDAAAVDARGWAWAGALRVSVNVVLIGFGVYLLRGWGINGASVGVLFATIVSWAIQQRLLMRASGLSFAETLEPQAAAVVCSAGLVLSVSVVRLLALLAWPALNPVVMLALSGSTGVAFYLTFLRLCWLPDVRELVSDVAIGLSPTFARKAGLA